MSKWQLTLIQDGKKLRKFGGTRQDVKWELNFMIRVIQSNSKSSVPHSFVKDAPFQIVVSKYNNIRKKKEKYYGNLQFWLSQSVLSVSLREILVKKLSKISLSVKITKLSQLLLTSKLMKAGIFV